MKKIQRLFSKFNINSGVMALITVLVLICALLPVYRLGLFSCPWYDDYGYGFNVKYYYSQEGFWGIFKGMISTIRGSWYSWQGTYASIGAMSLAGMSFGEKYYFIGVWTVITVIAIGIFAFSFTSQKRLLNADNKEAVVLSVLITLYLMEFIYISYQGFFWYNSAVHYTFMYGIMLLMMTCAINIVAPQNSKKISRFLWVIVTCILAVITAGANFVTCLQGLLFLLTIFAFALLRKNKKSLLILFPILCYSIGLYYNVSAPGNNNRAAFYTGESAIEAIIDSFKSAILYIPKITDVAALVMIVMMLPVLLNLAVKAEFSFKMPALVTALAFCLYSTGYTASFYSTASAPIDRTMIPVKFTYQLLLLFVAFYWIGWLVKRKKIEKKYRFNLAYFLILSLMILVCFTKSKDQAGGYLSYGSYYYVHTGEAQNFRQEYLSRIETILNSDGGDVAVEPIVFRPWLLIGKEELSTDPNAEPNTFMAKYYGVKSIYLNVE